MTMARISKLSTDTDFSVETRRERLRRERWQRHRSVILTFAFVLALFTSKVSPLLPWLLRTF
jgi:hypothetical protein